MSQLGGVQCLHLVGVQLQGLAGVVWHPKNRGRGGRDIAGRGELVEGSAPRVVRRDLKQRLRPELVVVVNLVDLLLQVGRFDPRERARKPRVIINDVTPKVENVHRASPVGVLHRLCLCGDRTLMSMSTDRGGLTPPVDQAA